jgi:hypothetical protein
MQGKISYMKNIDGDCSAPLYESNFDPAGRNTDAYGLEL